jgi:monofunctional biosynthetic peptidoglycan transglycosylase
VTDKGSQDETDAGADAYFPTGVPRSVGGPPTGGSAASRSEPEASDPEQSPAETATAEEFRTEPGAEPATDASVETEMPTKPPSPGETEARSYLPPVFEAEPTPSHADSANLPPIMSLRSETETEPAAPRLESHPPAFTSAAFDLFFPPETEVPPTYQTRGHQSYSQSSATPSGTEAVQTLVSDRERRKAQAVEWFWKVARYAGYAAVGYLALVLVLILVFRFVNPPASSLMLFQWLTGNSVDRTWVPINRVSPNLIRAVIVAEDGRFCEHAGIDFQAIGQAIEQASDGTPRGASTISMQVTKNMFLWSSKSYIRKIIELPLTLIMELVWPKWRILEVYLNIAEWGPGIFGAEAASRYHFHSPAARLSERQASLLAAALPNPIVRDAGDPSSRVSRKARVIQARMRAGGAGAAACVLSRI